MNGGKACAAEWKQSTADAGVDVKRRGEVDRESNSERQGIGREGKEQEVRESGGERESETERIPRSIGLLCAISQCDCQRRRQKMQ